jgi:hypothetical protein
VLRAAFGALILARRVTDAPGGFVAWLRHARQWTPTRQVTT